MVHKGGHVRDHCGYSHLLLPCYTQHLQ
jgi:hypothetical protein